jgi:hypothetical protein
MGKRSGLDDLSDDEEGVYIDDAQYEEELFEYKM